ALAAWLDSLLIFALAAGQLWILLGKHVCVEQIVARARNLFSFVRFYSYLCETSSRLLRHCSYCCRTSVMRKACRNFTYLAPSSRRKSTAISMTKRGTTTTLSC